MTLPLSGGYRPPPGAGSGQVTGYRPHVTQTGGAETELFALFPFPVTFISFLPSVYLAFHTTQHKNSTISPRDRVAQPDPVAFREPLRWRVVLAEAMVLLWFF